MGRLYEATDGENWTNSDNWLSTTVPIKELAWGDDR